MGTRVAGTLLKAVRGELDKMKIGSVSKCLTKKQQQWSGQGQEITGDKGVVGKSNKRKKLKDHL